MNKSVSKLTLEYMIEGKAETRKLKKLKTHIQWTLNIVCWTIFRIFGTGIGATAILHFFVPTAARLGPQCLIIVRILQGIADGVTFPASHEIWKWWAPPLDRTQLVTLALCGSILGAVVGTPVSEWLAEGQGWPAMFYFYGIFYFLLDLCIKLGRPKLDILKKRFFDYFHSWNFVKLGFSINPMFKSMVKSVFWLTEFWKMLENRFSIMFKTGWNPVSNRF